MVFNVMQFIERVNELKNFNIYLTKQTRCFFYYLFARLPAAQQNHRMYIWRWLRARYSINVVYLCDKKFIRFVSVSVCTPRMYNLYGCVWIYYINIHTDAAPNIIRSHSTYA